MKSLQMLLNVPTVGASGAIFGVLLAFGVLFPNTQLMLLFPPIPIKAKYFVFGYAVLELVLAVTQPGSNIAHAAHIGGMLFGYILIRYWRKTTKTLY
jgi:membrane associated rhomboid family serine protease